MNTSIDNSKHSFVSFIMKCCKAPEGELRVWLKKILPRYGFTIIEDDYLSERAKKNPKEYNGVHNLLALRGTSPKVCLVSHTDVCRDHGSKNSTSWSSVAGYSSSILEDDEYEYYKYFENKHSNRMLNASTTASTPIIDKPKIEVPLLADPVIKKMLIDGKEEFVIQDRDCKIQVGGDDRLGVAINTWIALNTSYDMGLLFTTDEEIGLKSAEKVAFPELKEFDLLVQTDRGNHSNELVLKIGNTQLCSYMTAVRLLEIALDLGFPRKPVNGAGTDVAAIKKSGFAKNAVNMTCGYHESFGSSSKEYIKLSESIECLKYVSEIVKSYYLESAGVKYSIENTIPAK